MCAVMTSVMTALIAADAEQWPIGRAARATTVRVCAPSFVLPPCSSHEKEHDANEYHDEDSLQICWHCNSR
jgi:hypothetical protein